MTTHTVRKKDSFLAQVIEATPGGERFLHCLQCGSCGGSCPSGADMEYTPRTIFALINAGERERCSRPTRCGPASRATSAPPAARRKSPSPTSCIRSSGCRSPSGCITTPTPPPWPRHLRILSTATGGASRLGLATSYHLLNRPLQAMKMGPMGFAMFRRGRMALTPSKIKNLGQLQAIIRKAKEISGEERSLGA